jgi:hypothetical protein
MQEDEETQTLSLEQGRKLIENTSLSHLNDDELQELLESIKVFCEINFEMYLDILRQVQMDEMDKDFSAYNVILMNENNQENLQKAA